MVMKIRKGTIVIFICIGIILGMMLLAVAQKVFACETQASINLKLDGVSMEMSILKSNTEVELHKKINDINSKYDSKISVALADFDNYWKDKTKPKSYDHDRQDVIDRLNGFTTIPVYGEVNVLKQNRRADTEQAQRDSSDQYQSAYELLQEKYKTISLTDVCAIPITPSTFKQVIIETGQAPVQAVQNIQSVKPAPLPVSIQVKEPVKKSVIIKKKFLGCPLPLLTCWKKYIKK